MDKQDEELIVEYQQGSQYALKELFLRYKAKVFNFALRLLQDRADAEDVTSDVFLALFLGKYTVSPHARLSTWLFTVARNACITRMRQRGRHIRLWFKRDEADDCLKQLDIPDKEDIPLEQLQRQEHAVLVKKAIAKLPALQRQALILREYHRMDYAQIAQVLDCSLANVKVLIFRARERLRQELSCLILEEDNDGAQ